MKCSLAAIAILKKEMRVIERAGCICCWTTSYPKGGQKEIFSKSFSVFDTFKKPALSRLQRRKKRMSIQRPITLRRELMSYNSSRAYQLLNFFFFFIWSILPASSLKKPALSYFLIPLFDGWSRNSLFNDAASFFSPISKIHLINVIQVCVFLFKRLL